MKAHRKSLQANVNAGYISQPFDFAKGDFGVIYADPPACVGLAGKNNLNNIKIEFSPRAWG
jgi:hypothetical protein